MTLFYIVLIISLLAGLFYGFFIIKFFNGWRKIKLYKAEEKEKPDINVSVVIAARNEEHNITYCLTSLIKQNYPIRLTEIIIVDDNSEDNTVAVCKDFISKNDIKNITLIELKNYNKITKKEAIKVGVAQAGSELILTTDADCVLMPCWILHMVSFYKKHNYKLISGPVVYKKSSGMFHSFQLLDFLSLIVCGAGAIGARMPFLGNAANMAFEKEAYNLVSEENYDQHYASGDDVFLLHKIKKISPDGIGFIKSKDAIVETEDVKTLKELFYQRIRWASKSAGYKDNDALHISTTVFLFNLIIVIAAFLSFFDVGFVPIAITVYVLKIITDFPLLYSIISFSNREYLFYHYLWVQLLYPFYISFLALTGLLIRNYSWKGRNNLK